MKKTAITLAKLALILMLLITAYKAGNDKAFWEGYEVGLAVKKQCTFAHCMKYMVGETCKVKRTK